LPESGTPLEPPPSDPEETLFALAKDLTRACATDQRAGLLEACAGAHYLVATREHEAREQLMELGQLARDIPGNARGRIRVRENGPYLVSGGPAIGSFLGEPIAAPPIAALCRCGQSQSRPWCDGTHATTGFNDEKHSDRVADQLDSYSARQFQILDNRGQCAHSGRCTDALPTVFRLGEEPFVAPAGGRADDILRAVQACPSGALGVAMRERRADEMVDSVRQPGIEVSKDGPYFVTGSVQLLDDAGNQLAAAAGASREHFALCRCGHSKNKPFCSGAHWYADFHDPIADPDKEPTLFEWVGGYPALMRMTRIFYERYVPEDDLLAPLFARMQPDHPERVAAWLSEVFGGPPLYSQRYGGYVRMLSQHLNKCLTEAQRSRWVSLLCRSADDALVSADPEFRAAFVAYLEWGSRLALENSQPGAVPPERMPVPRWWWVCNATPDARPASLPEKEQRVVEPEPPATPGPGETVGFERHIKGLFRARDRGAMRFAFDLWSVGDVRPHADAIFARLRDGTMPCDGQWPADKIAIFERWIVQGCAD
jgi:CDGSH-type Zn-finger protein/truncated hemoglobin YjbI